MATASNTANVDFAAAAVSAGEDATHFAVWRGGVAKATAAISTDPDATMAGQFYRFPAGTLELEIPAGDITPSGAADALNGILSGETQVSLHNGAPGDDGSAKELTSAATRATIPADGWTVA